ncbi:MAG: YebC/PmpR family DNA-binding transcriptional regulator [Deltaproteobacteria bacterium]|nr:YebC/PmpR family DNA-binding transcriptional regulator [Deltaproteobacteria bacterium]
MSGHNKWSTIKHKKAAQDAKRSKVWTKIIKEITVSARLGGGDPSGNPRLRSAIDKAKGANMPNDNIDRAIKKGTGELEGVSYEEITYEGYGPGGVAILVEVMTDNRTRTVAEIRHALEKYGGNLGASGSVAWIFKKRGLITLEKTAVSEDRLMEIAVDAGAEDVRDAGSSWEVETDPSTIEAVKAALASAKLETTSGEVTMLPQSRVKLDDGKAESMLKLMNALEDDDDVQNVYANFDIDDELLERLSA